MSKADWLRGMQDCFRLHPEMYASELEDDEDEMEEELRAREAATSGDPSGKPSAESQKPQTSPPAPELKKDATHLDNSDPVFKNATKAGGEVKISAPKAAHDATSK
jgi:intermembrane space import and assembly protein 40